jgi:hypothetical protein
MKESLREKSDLSLKRNTIEFQQEKLTTAPGQE